MTIYAYDPAGVGIVHSESAGFLTYPYFAAPSHPFLSEQWLLNGKRHTGLTAAGTVADSHRVPSKYRFFIARHIRSDRKCSD